MGYWLIRSVYVPAYSNLPAQYNSKSYEQTSVLAHPPSINPTNTQTKTV